MQIARRINSRCGSCSCCTDSTFSVRHCTVVYDVIDSVEMEGFFLFGWVVGLCFMSGVMQQHYDVSSTSYDGYYARALCSMSVHNLLSSLRVRRSKSRIAKAIIRGITSCFFSLREQKFFFQTRTAWSSFFCKRSLLLLTLSFPPAGCCRN